MVMRRQGDQAFRPDTVGRASLQKDRGHGATRYQESEMAKQPLVRNLSVDRKMKPYVDRMRLRPKDHQTSNSQGKMLVENSRNEMKKILLKKKIPEQAAERAIDKAGAMALDYQLEPLRRERCFSDKKQQRDIESAS
jgi:hypothetical protein